MSRPLYPTVLVIFGAFVRFTASTRGQSLLWSDSIQVMSAMSTPLQPRRSERSRALPPDFAGEQAGFQEIHAQLAALRRLERERRREAALAESQVDGTSIEDCSAMEEAAEGDENTDPNTQWSEGSADVTLPDWRPRRFCALPLDPTPTALGYLQCFLLPSLMDTIAENTNAYATLHGSPAG